jgi:isopentenyldiphosphate isomerase
MSSEEIIQLVDENDNIINKIPRSKLTNDDCWRIISLWITNDKGEVLLQQRSFDKKVAPGIWTAAVEGTVDYGDSYIVTAKREAEEEVGLNNLDIKKAGKYFGPWGGFGKRQCQGFTAIYNGDPNDFKIQKSEVNEVRWITVDEIKKFYQESPYLFPLYEIYKKLGFIS